MAIVKPSKPYTFIDGPGNTAVGAEVNDNFDTLYAKIGEVIDAINNASGSKVNLDARLDVALNEDGTPRSAVTSGGEWINPGFTATYISANQFSVPGDQRDIYQAGRRVKVGLAASTVYSTVSASTHGAGITTVTVGSVLTNPISSVEHGIVTPDNGSSSLPTNFMTTAATANKGVLRTAAGRVKAAAGSDADDAVVMSQLATTASPNTGVLRGATGEVNVSSITANVSGQTGYLSAAVRSFSPSGSAMVALANATSAAYFELKHGALELEARNTVGALIRVRGAAATSADDFSTKAQLDLKAPAFAGALATLSPATDIPDSTTTTVNFSGTSYDTAGFWSAGNPHRLTVPTGATVVRLTARTNFNSGTGYRSLNILKNSGVSVGLSAHVAGVAGVVGSLEIVSPPLVVVAGDFFYITLFQNSGSPLGIFPGNTFFSMEVLK